MRRTGWGGAIAAALGVAVVVAVVGLMDRGVAERALRAAWREPVPLAAALAAYTVGFALRAAAWGPLLPALVPARRRFRALLAMLAVNHAVPGPVGELARAHLVTGPRLRFRAALGSVVAARVVDAGSIATLAVAASLVAGEAPGWLRVVAPAGALVPVVALAIARRRGASLSWRQGAVATAWAIPSWLLECGVVAAVAAGAGVRLSVAACVLATCGAVLAQVGAVLPGGVGTYEAGMTSVLVVLGVPPGDALAVAATSHAVKFAYAFAFGLPALGWRSPARLVQAARQHRRAPDDVAVAAA